MRKVMDEKTFLTWADTFLPHLRDKAFTLAPAKVGDRSDGKLVHLDVVRGRSTGWQKPFQPLMVI